MLGSTASRFPFLIATALIAVAIADPIVETVANSGLLGGHYADDNHCGVVPTLIVGAIFSACLALMRLRALARATDVAPSPESLVGVARHFAERSILRDLPSVLVLQFLALFVLESAEQISFGGRLLGGLAWLGGPLTFSVLVHSLIGVACTLALRALMRAIVAAFAAIVRTVWFIWLAGAGTVRGCVDLERRERPHPRAGTTYVRQIGGRAPPLLPTLDRSLTTS